MRVILSRLVVILFLAIPAASSAAKSQTPLDRAFHDYFVAESPKEAGESIDQIVNRGATFDMVWSRLKAGRAYSDDVATGRVDLSRQNAEGVTFYYTILIPESYDPNKKYPVRVHLHGDVNRPPPERGGTWWEDLGRFASADRISVFPAGWHEAMWWHGNQVENLHAILDDLKRSYNVDENRVYLLGISDGGTGVYFQAFRASTPWAAFLSFISDPSVLAEQGLGVDGEMYVPNLANKPLFVVSGARDRLYPAASVAPYVDLFSRAGTNVLFRPQPESGHDLRWWPAERARIDSFIQANPRDALPNRIAWETERTDRYHRAHWAMITKLGPVDGESTLDDFNTVVSQPSLFLGIEPNVASTHGVLVFDIESGSVADSAGLRAGDVIVEANGTATNTLRLLAEALQGAGYGSIVPIVIERNGKRQARELRFPAPRPVAARAFPHTRESGRIVLEHDGNTVLVRTRGVRRFKLLLSPDQFDLARPVRVIANGIESFNGRVTLDPVTLLQWAAIDNDRTMLFAAELEIDLTQ
jgi:predicted esterase